MSQDPFPTALHNLQQNLADIPSLLQSLHRILSTSSATSPEAQSAQSDLSSALEDLDADLSDLRDSVSAAERNPQRFALTQQEVRGRRDAVGKVAGEIAQLKQRAASFLSGGAMPESPTTPFPAYPPSPTQNRSHPSQLPDPDAFDDEHDDAYAAYEQQTQDQIMAEQDQALEGVFSTVGNLRAQADEMGRELEEQAGMIDEVDVTADRVGGKLGQGIKRVEWIYRRNEERLCGGCCVAVLIVVLIILLVLVLVL
ncbi:MAG: hypothetical protein Q9159_000206 [Coniocarpon cinnabarinum]